MIFRSTGRVKDNFYILGLATYPLHLLDGPHPVLFEGGTSCAGKLYVDAIRSILGERQPEILFLTHVHWDHCGAVSYLKQAFPKMKIAASLQAVQILQRPRALELIAKLNKDAQGILSNLPGIDSSRLLDGSFYPFEVDIQIEDRQIFDLGHGTSVEVLATPGHTRDHHSYYISDQKILVAGDAAGTLDSSGNIMCEFLYDYEAYITTIEKLAALPIEVFCQGHRLVLVGRDEVKDFFESSMKKAVRFKNQVFKLLDEECGSTDRVVQRIKKEYYDNIPEPKQPEIPYLLNLTAQVKHLAALSKDEKRDEISRA
ncbi:MAG TPA: MBL fold metallo-hydrolase [Firmicutes bacterium]|jgi:glyoxylase-like metal-dependent hydrolase (beta-lactamase superfamily II)|nr:MBL fold metallo-hydrolase [Bacillota bacterium]